MSRGPARARPRGRSRCCDSLAALQNPGDRRSVMLKWFMKRKLKAFGDAFDYDTSYMQELVDVDPAAGLAVSRLSAVASYRADAPAAAWFAGKLVAGMSEDCGPCVQLGVRMAERSGVSASDLRAIIAGDIGRMSAEASLGYRFAKALLARSAELDEIGRAHV